jgi:hypothetical protein
MKVRWMEGSLRLRITPGELAALMAGETSTETAVFPGGWTITLRPGPQSTVTSDAPGTVVLTLAPDSVTELARPETEGVYFTKEQAGYRFLVEKDFPCVHPRPAEALEPVTETFDAPAGFAERKQ